MVIRQYGSIEKYTEAMKENIAKFPETMEQMNAVKEKADGYPCNPAIIEATDKKYGAGASAFIGNALKVYWGI